MKTNTAIILLLSASLALRADPLPDEALDLLKKRQELVSNIDEKLLAALEKVKASAMKNGDLDAANAVDALMEERAKDGGSNGGNSPPVPKERAMAPILFRPGMKLLWSPDDHWSAYFVLEEGGKIRNLDDKAWGESTAKWKWESKVPGNITLTTTGGATTFKQRKDGLLLEGSLYSDGEGEQTNAKKGTRVRLTVVAF